MFLIKKCVYQENIQGDLKKLLATKESIVSEQYLFWTTLYIRKYQKPCKRDTTKLPKNECALKQNFIRDSKIKNENQHTEWFKEITIDNKRFYFFKITLY